MMPEGSLRGSDGDLYGVDLVVDQSIETCGHQDLSKIVTEHKVLFGKLAPTDVVVDVTKNQVDSTDLQPFTFDVIKPSDNASRAGTRRIDSLDLSLVSKALSWQRIRIEFDPGDLGQHHFLAESIHRTDQDPRGLRHSFDDQTPGHDRKRIKPITSIEMVVKVFFGEREVLDRMHADPFLERRNGVDPHPTHDQGSLQIRSTLRKSSSVERSPPSLRR